MALENISPIQFSGISHVTAAPVCALGTERLVAGEKYLYVYNCGGSATGTGVAMSRPASAFAGIYSGSVSSVSGDMALGFVKHVSIPSAEYGWALVRGLVTVAVASSASDQAAGPKTLGANGLVATAGAGNKICGELTTAIVSGNSGSLLVNLG